VRGASSFFPGKNTFSYQHALIVNADNNGLIKNPIATKNAYLNWFGLQ